MSNEQEPTSAWASPASTPCTLCGPTPLCAPSCVPSPAKLDERCCLRATLASRSNTPRIMTDRRRPWGWSAAVCPAAPSRSRVGRRRFRPGGMYICCLQRGKVYARQKQPFSESALSHMSMRYLVSHMMDRAGVPHVRGGSDVSHPACVLLSGRWDGGHTWGKPPYITYHEAGRLSTRTTRHCRVIGTHWISELVNCRRL
jgi:hypothetical protein